MLSFPSEYEEPALPLCAWQTLKPTNHTVCITETGGSSANCSREGRKKKAQTRPQILLEGMFTTSAKHLLLNILSL